MLDEKLQRLRTARLDDSLLPTEIAELVEGGEQLPFAILPLLQSGQRPVPYEREIWSEDAAFFSANQRAKSLIVAFCGAENRLGVPLSYFLQMIRADLYDVVIFRDPKRLYYDLGVRGFSSGLLDTVRRTEAFANHKGYGEIITFGNSMGGYPALRAGMLMGASRSISICGGFSQHASRLKSSGEYVKAFDHLCACYQDYDLPLVAVAASRNKKDFKNFEILQRNFPQCCAVLVDTHRHGVLSYFASVNLLQLFLSFLFENWSGPSTLLERVRLLNGAARAFEGSLAELRCNYSDLKRKHNKAQQRYEEEIHSLDRSLSLMRTSRSWRFTAPLRYTKDTLRRCLGVVSSKRRALRLR